MEKLTEEDIHKIFRALELDTPESRFRFLQLRDLSHLAEPSAQKEQPLAYTSNTSEEEDTNARLASNQ